MQCGDADPPRPSIYRVEEAVMEPREPLVCTCEKCGNEAEMTVRCEEVVAAPATPAVPRRVDQIKRTVVCSRCGNEAEMVVDYAGS